jgi:hypothetical protein
MHSGAENPTFIRLSPLPDIPICLTPIFINSHYFSTLRATKGETLPPNFRTILAPAGVAPVS